MDAGDSPCIPLSVLLEASEYPGPLQIGVHTGKFDCDSAHSNKHPWEEWPSLLWVVAQAVYWQTRGEGSPQRAMWLIRQVTRDIFSPCFQDSWTSLVPMTLELAGSSAELFLLLLFSSTRCPRFRSPPLSGFSSPFPAQCTLAMVPTCFHLPVSVLAYSFGPSIMNNYAPFHSQQ